MVGNGSDFDAIVIGTGQGGVPLAMAFAAAGNRTAIIERAAVGGTCINYGCTPSKTLVHIAKVAETVRRSGEYGVRSSAPEIDMLKVRELKRNIVAEFSEASEADLKATENLELIFGHARFDGERRLQIQLREGGIREVAAETVVINVGTRALIPDIPGLDSVRYLDNVSIMELDHVPAALTVLGGGYIGLEFAQMFSRFGSKVTVLERGKRFLPHVDEDVAAEVLKLLKEDAIDVKLGIEVLAVAPSKGRISVKTGKRGVVSDELLVAVGRKPNTDDLGLESTTVELDERGYIRADSRLRTTAEGVYVIGDVNGEPAFTHISYDDFRILKANLLDGGARSTTVRATPTVAFIDPELAHIGMTEEDASLLSSAVLS